MSMGSGTSAVLPCLISKDTATSRSVTFPFSLTFSFSLIITPRRQFGAPTKVSDARLMSNDGKMEKSFVSFKAAHPEWMPADPSGSLYLSRIADLSARRASDDQTPRPNVSTAKDRTREYERALHESQTAAVRRRAVGVGFGTTSTMLGQSTGTMYHSGMAQSVSLGDSDGSVAFGNLPPLAHPPLPPPPPSSSSAGAGAPVASGVSSSSSGSGSGIGELGGDSQGEVRSALGGSYVDGARRHPRGGVSARSSMQEEEDEDALGEEGGVLGLLAQIYSGTSGAGARGVLS
jgi:autophagy-related protein 9